MSEKLKKLKRNIRRNPRILLPGIIVLLAVIATFAVLLIINRYEMILTIDGETEYTVEYGEDFEAPKAEAHLRGTILHFIIGAEVQTESDFNPEVLGDYRIRYTAEKKKVRDEKEVLIHLVDTKAPVIELLTNPDQVNPVGGEYIEEGFSAEDNYDGDLTEKVVITEGETPDERIYTVSDSSGNETSVTRTILHTDAVPVVSLLGEKEITLEAGTEYEEPGFTAEDEEDGDLSASVISESTLDTLHPGVYTITYTVSDSLNQKGEEIRTVHVVDTTPPVITLVQNNPYTTPGTTYVEEGYSAIDTVDGDLTASVVRDESESRIVYHVADSSGNYAEVTREIIYKDVNAPVLSLGGSSKIYLAVGTGYAEPGYSATDDVDGDLTASVAVDGLPDTNTVGTYTVRYRVADQGGNAAEASRQVFVYQPQQSAVQNPGSKIIYLTFDDGPSPYTPRLLDILDQFGVKATFFVTSQFPDHVYLIGEEARRGHTVAIHTKTHRYDIIYSSEDAFWADINEMNDIVAAQTGARSNLLRFPGGTSNTVSRRYCEGIMSRLSASAEAHGYLFCDWNVSADDAAGNGTVEGIVNKVIREIQSHDVSYVLQHDIIEASVNAVPEIIAWGLANGYTFLPITASTPMTHQAVQN